MTTALLSEDWTTLGDPEPDGEPTFPTTPAERERKGPRRIRVRPSDVVLPLAMALWLAGVRAVEPAAMNDYGLLPALPVIFFAALALLLGSISALFVREQLSPVRLGLHLVALVVMLHGTIPLIFSGPNFPWAYKHIGVVNYIHLYGSLDSSVDIYQNWPGLFALSAWFDNVAGVGGPLAYAAWAPVYFNLLTCLELAFVFRFLPVTRRVRWLALFLFVVGNWVGQDYFAPQALAFVLSLAVFGMLLAWFQVDRPPAVVRAIRRMASLIGKRRRDRLADWDFDPEPSLRRAPPRIVTLAALFGTFAVVVVIHPLSPYVVILGAGLLTIAGLVRPRWLVVGLLGLAIGYLFVRLPYIRRTQDLFVSLGDPLHNVDSSKDPLGVPMEGRRLTALAAPALIAGLWGLAAIGILRRLRARRTALVVALLAASPGLIALGQSYGGEAVFRIYLFSLPWVAVLGACALDSRPRRWPFWSWFRVAGVLWLAAALFLSAFFGAEELYVVRPGEVAASQYFYENAEPDSVFFTVTALMFPIRVSGRYAEFRAIGDNPPNLLSTNEHFRHRVLGADDLPAISTFVGTYVPGGAPGRYLVLSTGQDVYARVLGLLPPGSMASLDRALAESPNWGVFYRNADAVIYELNPRPVEEPGGLGPDGTAALGGAAARPSLAVVPATFPGRSRDWLALSTGALGLALTVLVWRRRRAMAARGVDVVIEKEETMHSSAARNGRDPDLTRFRELVATVEPARRSEAVRLLAEAWGPTCSAEARPLLEDLKSSVLDASATGSPPARDTSDWEEGVLEWSGDSLSELRDVLRDDLFPANRVAAIRALARAPEGDQLWALSMALDDPAPEVRACAIEWLPVAGTVRAARSLIAASEDHHEQVRNAAYVRLAVATRGILWMAVDRCSRLEELCVVLSEHTPPDLLSDVVMERVSSPEPRDRSLAVQLACRFDIPGWVEESITALQDPDAMVRRAAVAQLGGCPEAVSALVTAMQGDPDPLVRTGAASALDGVKLDRALPAFIGALQDPEACVRGNAMDALVTSSSRGLARRVADELSSANSSSAGEVLLRMGTVGEEALVTAAVEGRSDRASVAASLLGRTGTVKDLLGQVRAVDPATRLRAVEALGVIGGAEALGGLVAALSDCRPEIRSRAAFHLGQMGDRGGREFLQQVSERDHAPEVLRATAEALRLIDERAPQAVLFGDGD